MGNAVKSFAKNVATAAAKGVVSWAGGKIPIIGGPIANWINSKYAVGTSNLGTVGDVKVPEGMQSKLVSTPAQLQALVKQFPDQAMKAGLTADMIKTEVAAAKSESKAIGGKIKISKVGLPEDVKPKKMKKMAVGGVPKEEKAKKPRSEAQKKAFEKMLAAKKKK